MIASGFIVTSFPGPPHFALDFGSCTNYGARPDKRGDISRSYECLDNGERIFGVSIDIRTKLPTMNAYLCMARE